MKIEQKSMEVVMMELTDEEMTLVCGGWGDYGYGYGYPCVYAVPIYTPCVYAVPVYTPCYGYGWN